MDQREVAWRCLGCVPAGCVAVRLVPGTEKEGLRSPPVLLRLIQKLLMPQLVLVRKAEAGSTRLLEHVCLVT
ncbi:unnamed protein product [Litomosoides sigmodontis]|uniref:Uncharacterized protein n=1 Tax=Litomosoides sigmodontis TaxID=42156 RepID=A0A3P6TKQ2_LITSI|nr:unnamed protein product [Litomosoides sigmodontis]